MFTHYRLVTQVQSYVSQSEMVTPEPREEKWNDFIQEFWENHLPHFRRHGYVYRTVSPSSSHASDYPENTESSSKILDELFRCSSETNILTTIAEEELTSESSSVVEPTLVDDGETIDMWCITNHRGKNLSPINENPV